MTDEDRVDADHVWRDVTRHVTTRPGTPMDPDRRSTYATTFGWTTLAMAVVMGLVTGVSRFVPVEAAVGASAGMGIVGLGALLYGLFARPED